MHAHSPPDWWLNVSNIVGVLAAVGLLAIVLMMFGMPIPIGFDRGKVEFISWCGTGMHFHVVYWHGENDGSLDGAGFQSIHPADLNGGGE